MFLENFNINLIKKYKKGQKVKKVKKKNFHKKFILIIICGSYMIVHLGTMIIHNQYIIITLTRHHNNDNSFLGGVKDKIN